MTRSALTLAALLITAAVSLALAAPALAAPQNLKLTVTGPGSVSDNTGAISGCEEAAGTCEAQYEEGTVLTLFANHNERTAFAAWQGCETENGTECTLTIGPSPAEVRAEFEALPQQTLKVATEGTGAGTITGTSPGFEFAAINCVDNTETCEATYNQGATIILYANRATHSRFTGWSGCPNVLSSNEYGTSECEVTLSSAAEVKAAFEPIPQQSLEVSVSGEGEVQSSPGGIACTEASSPCTEHFDREGPDSTVTLFAYPSYGSHFEAWNGECESTSGNECVVSMTQARSLSASFAPTMHNLTVTPSGPGSLGADSGAISGCEAGAGTCSGSYQEGKTVTLTAAPASHYHVVWSGCAVSESNPNVCEATIGEGDMGVEASFQINLHTLTIDRSGLGSVSASSGAISECSPTGGVCSGEYDEASTVVLTATPHAHYHVEWSGCAVKPGEEDVCELEIPTADAEVHAAFHPNMHALTVIPSGEGSIHANSGAISHCSSSGGTCSGNYIEAATLTLFASPGPHQAVSWSGCTAIPAEEVCEVEVPAAAAEVKASFSQVTHPLYITKAGSGSGLITCNGEPCAASYPEGAELTIAATPTQGSSFAGFSGAGCSGTAPCHLRIEATTALTATFTANPPPPVEEGSKPPLTCRRGFVPRGGASKQSKSGSSAQRAMTKHFLSHGRCVRRRRHHHHRHRKGH